MKFIQWKIFKVKEIPRPRSFITFYNRFKTKPQKHPESPLLFIFPDCTSTNYNGGVRLKSVFKLIIL